MERRLALIIKEQIVGTYTGHMSNIPHNPVLHAMFTTLCPKSIYGVDDDEFAKALREIADALDPKEAA